MSQRKRKGLDPHGNFANGEAIPEMSQRKRKKSDPHGNGEAIQKKAPEAQRKRKGLDPHGNLANGETIPEMSQRKRKKSDPHGNGEAIQQQQKKKLREAQRKRKGLDPLGNLANGETIPQMSRRKMMSDLHGNGEALQYQRKKRAQERKRKKSDRSGNLANEEETQQQQKKKRFNDLMRNFFIYKKNSALHPHRISQGKGSNNTAEHMNIIDQTTGIHFQEEIIMEILCRLPVRSLHQFKCVSKSWRALISDPYFKEKHLNHAKNDRNFHKLIAAKSYVDEDASYFYCSLSPYQVMQDKRRLVFPSNLQPSDCSILCCCDGLVLLSVINPYDHPTGHPLVLWNPSIQESIALPCPPLPLAKCVFGLGYDITTNYYKILAIDLKDFDRYKDRVLYNEIRYKVVHSEILALKGGGSWRSSKYPSGIHRVQGFLDSGMDSLALLHGAFHWIGLKRHDCAYTLVSFDISKEVYGEIPLLEGMCCVKEIRPFHEFVDDGISVLGGMLCFYSTYTNEVEGKGTYKLWVMKDYGVKESWTKLLSIQEDDLFYAARPKYWFVHGKVLLSVKHIERFGCVFRNWDEPLGLWYRGDVIWEEGIIYTESLISPKLLLA